jgi:hypothetical protein
MPASKPPSRPQDDMPSTVARSGAKARRTWRAVHDTAADNYGDGERAHRTAFGALKHTHEKVGDHWEPKDEPGPSDAQAAKRGPAARASTTPTHGGVDANASKAHLYELARRLDVPGRSSMTKAELVEALDAANQRATREAAEN